MRILEINIQNFRKLLQCHIEFSEKTTLFVGANNSGKTSAMDALGKFLADRNFTFNDITISERSAINVIGERWIQKDCEEPTTITEWESLMPKMDIWLNVASNEMHYVAWRNYFLICLHTVEIRRNKPCSGNDECKSSLNYRMCLCDTNLKFGEHGPLWIWSLDLYIEK